MRLMVNVQLPDGGLERRELVFDACVAIGYAGRDQASVRRHVEELARLGVPAPATVPSLYWVAPYLVQCADCVQVVGAETSAEVEVFVAPDSAGRLYVTVVSDHSDRRLESVSVAKAKQICPKIIAGVFWPLDDVKDHWDQLELSCYAVDSERRLYQQAPLASLLSWDELYRRAQEDGPVGARVAFCSGTVPVVGGELCYAPQWDIQLKDPVLGRSVGHAYAVTVLEDRN